MPRLQKVIIIVGPTAVGKTGLGVMLAQTVNGEVVSADSRQVYRGLDIGTGKATMEEMQAVPHHLLDVVDPEDTYTAADFVRNGRIAISKIATHGHIPIVVGGTGFYIDALLGNVSLAEVAQDAELRSILKEKKLLELQKELEKLDPHRAATIDAKNRVRLVRAIEIARALGSVPETVPQHFYDALWIGITVPKKELEEKISARLHARMEAGMLEEAKKLHAAGLSYERMEELGLEYRYMARHLEGKITKEEMLAQLETEIKKYARRQMTWFKKNKQIKWFSTQQSAETLQLVKDFLGS